MTDQRTPPSQASTAELLSQATADISTLVRDELALARRDLAKTGKRVGVGAGLLGLAGTLALYGLAALIATIILAIAQGLEPWIAAGIVSLALFVAAGVAALVGKGSIGRATDPPQQRVESVKADIETVKHGTHDAGGDRG